MYYSLQYSLNTKIVGKFFQSENIAYNYGHIDNPKLLNNIYFKKVDFEPIVPRPILLKKTKITDLISCVNATSAGQLIISGKLKSILEKHKKNGLQFFKTSLVRENMQHDNYYVMNMYESNMEYIDLERSTIYYEKQNDDYKFTYKTSKIYLKLKNLSELAEYIEIAKIKLEIVCIEKIAIKNIIASVFFMLRNVESGARHIVSENLKKEIEDAGCTGIEFQPIELSYNEWTASGGEREKVYGKS